MTPARLRRIADDFWRRVPDLADVRPRPIRAAVEAALPMTVVDGVDPLTPAAIASWLLRHGHVVHADGDERLLGCLHAARGHGHLFVAPGQDEDGERFTVAHEAAHFLLHHDLPRREAGGGVLAVLDGDRPATPAERLGGALAARPVRPHVHLYRGDSEDAAEAECDALVALLLDLPRRPRRPDPVVALARRVLGEGGGR